MSNSKDVIVQEHHANQIRGLAAADKILPIPLEEGLVNYLSFYSRVNPEYMLEVPENFEATKVAHTRAIMAEREGRLKVVPDGRKRHDIICKACIFYLGRDLCRRDLEQLGGKYASVK